MVSSTEHDQRWFGLFYLLGPINKFSEMLCIPLFRPSAEGRCRFRSAALVKTLSKPYCLGNDHPNLQTWALELGFLMDRDDVQLILTTSGILYLQDDQDGIAEKVLHDLQSRDD